MARMAWMRIVLASASPARHALLTRSGLAFDVMVSGVDEETDELLALDPITLAHTLAEHKAVSVASRIEGPALVIGCDSVFEQEGIAYGKPLDPKVAIERWQQMRGKSGTLHTGHCVVDTGTGRRLTATASTDVGFADISDDEIAAYVASGEPLHVAGAFTIDSLGGPYIDWIHGDPSCVEGLSLPLLRRIVEELGYRWHSLREQRSES
jgi:septum formation protein